MYYVSKSFWLTGSTPIGSPYLGAIDSKYQPVSLSLAITTTGWTVGTNASGSYASMTASVDVARTIFTTAVSPNNGLSSTIGEGWVLGPFTGVFIAPQTMSFIVNLIATSNATQRGLIKHRLWKADDRIGTNASLIFPIIFNTNIIQIGLSATSSVSSSIPVATSIIMENKYLFIESAWAITNAGGNVNNDVFIRAGSASYFKTGPFEDNTFIMLSDDGNPGWSRI